MNYTTDQLRTQLAIAERELSKEHQRLSALDRVPADVRENHKKTIEMRMAHYSKRIADLKARIG